MTVGRAVFLGSIVGIALAAMCAQAYKLGALAEHQRYELAGCDETPNAQLPSMIRAHQGADTIFCHLLSNTSMDPDIPMYSCAAREVPACPACTSPGYDSGFEVGYASARADFRSGWIVAPKP